MKLKLYLFLIIIFVVSFSVDTANIPRSTTKSSLLNRIALSSTNSTQNRQSANKIITTRIGADGLTPEQQCQCVLFYLCDKENVFDLSANSSNSGNQCDELQVCCRLPYTYNESLLTDVNAPSSTENVPTFSDLSTVSVTSSFLPAINNNSCICLPADQCSNPLDPAITGSGLIDIRTGACKSQEVCCLSTSSSSSTTESGWFTPSLTVPTSSEPFSAFVTPTSSNIPPPSDQCGFRRTPLINRIVAPENENFAAFGEFPWMSLVLKTDIDPISGSRTENVFVCGGSLLSSRIVLTAAHCVQNLATDLLKLRLGEYDTFAGAQNEPLPHQDRRVIQKYIHPNFNPKTLYNDFALLVTSEPFTFAENVAPICAPFVNTAYANPNAYDDSRCVATGWGKNTSGNNAMYQTILKKVDLSLVPREECQRQLRLTRLGQSFVLDPSFICAGGQQNRDTCEGDGGGPLICALRSDVNRYVQVGVVSWGIGCGDQLPAAYASLEYNTNWLTSQFNMINIF